MSGFRLLAIIPLKGCDVKYRKNLIEGKIYQFYNSHTITVEDNLTGIAQVIKNIDYKVPSELYNLKNGIEVNVSAVVGENGSGKSTLFELLYLLIYVIGTDKDLNDNAVISLKSKDLEGILESLNTDLVLAKRLIILSDLTELDEDDFISANNLIQKYNFPKLRKTNSIKTLYEKAVGKIEKEIEEEIKNIEQSISSEIEAENKIKKGLALSIIYEIEGQIKEVKYFQNELAIRVINNDNDEKLDKSKKTKIDLASFFYSISLNYSHHSLNSKTLGSWVTKLFHKNDGYLTPVVINPMRNEGNFDINKELRLSKERLMGNILYDIIQGNDTLLLEKYKLTKFVFSLKPNFSRMVIELEDPNFIKELYSGKLITKSVGITRIPELIGYWDVALDYLEKKIQKIKRNYPSIIRDLDFETFLEDDKSHITKKVRQSINFLKGSNSIKHKNFWKEMDGFGPLEYKPEEIISWIHFFTDDIKKLSPSDLIEYALPGFFNIDFKFENQASIDFKKKLKNTSDDFIKSDDMSSGEQQMLFNTNAILYHAYNLQSVFQSSNRANRIEYKYLNIILDEIELYYHPEMQRQLLNTILTSLEKLEHEKEGIKAINIILLTHSPFVLSDIPSSNVLRLTKNGTESFDENEETFASNIHELLASSFFMETLIGKFADNKIIKLIESIEKGEDNLNNQLLIDLIGDSFLKEGIKEFKSQQNDKD